MSTSSSYRSASQFPRLDEKAPTSEISSDKLSNSFRGLCEDAARLEPYCWDFVVYRVTYDDQAAWERYITNLYDRAIVHLEVIGVREKLESGLNFAVIEGRSKFEGVSKEETRVFSRPG